MTDDEPAPYEVVAEERVFKLRRYYPGTNDGAPAVLLVPPLMLAADVYDVSRGSSAVTILHEHGVDPWVGRLRAPEEGRTRAHASRHVLAVSEAVDCVRERTGSDVHLGGYSHGGMFVCQTAAYRRNDGLASGSGR